MRLSLLLFFLLFILSAYARAAIPTKNNPSMNNKNTLQLLDINLPNHTVLRQPAQTILFPLDHKTREFVQTFLAFFNALKSPLGTPPVGLAATQVGYPLQIIIVQVPPEVKGKRKDVLDVLPATLLINPSYTPVPAAGEVKDWEGCFSIPNKMGEVYRYYEIHYTAYTAEGEKITGIAKGFLARVLQHEIDHLQGKLYTDRLRADCRYEDLDKAMAMREREADRQLT
jgi:peptide deformylase